MDVKNMWFQQDCTTCHTANETIQLLGATFNGGTVSRWNDVIWAPRSRDLTLLDFLLWGYLNIKVYINKSQSIEYSKEEIRHNIHGICQ